ncbi:MAG: RNA-binding S4 domain-containing protein [Caldicoprobacterales bacterium]|jgi:ribosomal 50S subunit-recycling heat shock protein|nr:RNA-binding S4 domain-containing protein [Clostridiales bacterium]
MRVDKFLKVSRIIKRRTMANQACTQGRVMINGKLAKPGSEVNVGDKIEIHFGDEVRTYEVLDVSEHVSKGDAASMYRIL